MVGATVTRTVVGTVVATEGAAETAGAADDAGTAWVAAGAGRSVVSGAGSVSGGGAVPATPGRVSSPVSRRTTKPSPMANTTMARPPTATSTRRRRS